MRHDWNAPRARKLIRKLNSRSKTFLIESDDGTLYVVKFAGNPLLPNILGNEMLGSILAAAVGLPVARLEPIAIDDQFLESNRILLSNGRRLPEAGLHGGCRFLGEVSGSTRSVQYICDRDSPAISNRSDFLGMYIFDVWANNQKSRKAVFVRNSDTSELQAIFINHANLFSLPTRYTRQNTTRISHLKTSLYSGLWKKESVDRWVRLLQAVCPPVLASTLPIIPRDWSCEDVGVLHTWLLERLGDLPKLVESQSLADDSDLQGILSGDEL